MNILFHFLQKAEKIFFRTFCLAKKETCRCCASNSASLRLIIGSRLWGVLTISVANLEIAQLIKPQVCGAELAWVFELIPILEYKYFSHAPLMQLKQAALFSQPAAAQGRPAG